MTANHRIQTCVPRDHPCLAGHFEGNPIVPGVLLLELVAEAARTMLNQALRIEQVPLVKFLSPLRPDEPCSIELHGNSDLLRFRCDAAGRLIASGAMKFVADDIGRSG